MLHQTGRRQSKWSRRCVWEGNYQTLITDALRTYVAERKRPLELVLRRVVREELGRAQGQR